MILLHLISDDEKQAIEIVDFLMEKSLLLEGVISEKVLVRKKGTSGKPESFAQILIIGQTKALLYNTIEKMYFYICRTSLTGVYNV